MVEAIDREHSGLSGRGRVLVRASGTEPLIRVMVEAPTEAETDAVCDRLTETVKAILGPELVR
jgi:phosphoglucosamine mutase